MIRLVIDCLGGDHSPSANILGSLLALNQYSDLELVLAGDEKQVLSELKGHPYDSTRLSILHAPDVIGCDEAATAAVAQKKNSSLVKAFELVRTDESIHGVVSTGSTGALVAASVLRLGRIHGLKRPAFCPVLPTMNGGIVGVCDSGANISVTVRMLQQFAVMGSRYLECAYNVDRPRVALLNVGTEPEKGDELRKAAFPALASMDSIRFAGNMESRDLLSGEFDLVVCDGFSGNVLLKATEGACLEMLKKLKRDICSKSLYKFGALFQRRMFEEEKRFMDYRNYGGSVLLGCSKIVVKGHGSSNAAAVCSCIAQAYRMQNAGLNDRIERDIRNLNKTLPDEQA